MYVLKARLAMYFAPFFGASQYDIAEAAITEAYALAGGRIATASEFVSIFANGEVGVNSVLELQFLDNDNLGVNSLWQIYVEGAYGDINTVSEVKDILFADADDIRGTLIGPDTRNVLRNNGKYMDRADNVKLMRFEEIVLIAAEVAFRKGDTAAAANYINALVSNRGLSVSYTSSDITLDIILDERRKELIFEGFRFDDLMRLQMDIPAIVERAPENTPAYGDYRLAFPIPQGELNVSSIPQNEGY
jgi:starch-binding outer membrane protein, SusD/RagB family